MVMGSHFSLRKAAPVGREVAFMFFVTKKQTQQVSRWPLLWKRCRVSLVGGDRNNDKNVLVCFSFCLDTTHCYQTSLLFLFFKFVLCCFISGDKNSSGLVNSVQAVAEKRPRARCLLPLWMDALSLIRKDSGLTAGAHDRIEWTGCRLWLFGWLQTTISPDILQPCWAKYGWPCVAWNKPRLEKCENDLTVSMSSAQMGREREETEAKVIFNSHSSIYFTRFTVTQIQNEYWKHTWAV